MEYILPRIPRQLQQQQQLQQQSSETAEVAAATTTAAAAPPPPTPPAVVVAAAAAAAAPVGASAFAIYIRKICSHAYTSLCLICYWAQLLPVKQDTSKNIRVILLSTSGHSSVACDYL